MQAKLTLSSTATDEFQQATEVALSGGSKMVLLAGVFELRVCFEKRNDSLRYQEPRKGTKQ